ncbi:MAG: DUF502 domain-containing protein [Alphaproteobacteria bacterium]
MPDKFSTENLRNQIQDEIEEKGWWGWFRTNLMTGLLVAAPAILTWWLVVGVVFWVDNGLKSILPEALHLKIANIPGLGLLGGAVLLTAIGVVARNYLGKKLLDWADTLFENIPVVRSIYGAAKQLVGAFGGGDGDAARFGEVVMIEYPRQGVWTLGFVAGPSTLEQPKTKGTKLIVFVPSAPSPTNGFVLVVPEADVLRPGISVDDGWKMVMSGGIVTPKIPKKKR